MQDMRQWATPIEAPAINNIHNLGKAIKIHSYIAIILQLGTYDSTFKFYFNILLEYIFLIKYSILLPTF